MPKVGNKHYPYTAKGKADAKRALTKMKNEATPKPKKPKDAPLSAEDRRLEEEDRAARVRRSNATSGMKKGGMVRGCGKAKRGVRKAKMR